MANITRHEFTGQEGLDNVHVVNMNGRVYIPSGSMFISPDPTIPDPTNTLSYNRYAYVNYNPLTQIDPSGFENIDGYKTYLARQAYTGKTLTIRQDAIATLFAANAAEEMAAESGALGLGGGGGDDLAALVAAVQGRLDGGLQNLGISRSTATTPLQGSVSCDGNGGNCIVTVEHRAPQGNQSPYEVVTGHVAASPFLQTALPLNPQRFDIYLDRTSYAHIFARHVWWPLSDTSRYAPQFGNMNSINGLFEATIHSTLGFPEGNGNYYFSTDLGFTVGTDQLGFATSLNTVIVEVMQQPTPSTHGLGRVVTMYPGQ
jgi:RHS repeat-associated protein